MDIDDLIKGEVNKRETETLRFFNELGEKVSKCQGDILVVCRSFVEEEPHIDPRVRYVVPPPGRYAQHIVLGVIAGELEDRRKGNIESS